MDNEMIERYKAEMMKTYNSRTLTDAESESKDNYGDSGHLIVSVTTQNGLFPLPRATVKVFKGSIEEMNIVDSDTTDESGQTKTFSLPAPDRELSQNAGAVEPVYTNYSLMVQADGYVDEINVDLPVFRGVTSLQNVDMILRASANGDSPIINDENGNYDL